ncbi:hypothetical protein JMA_09810 [Jeotgalibacillus malaysiensis]|uniref:AbiEi antitoxin N-terminal domain-containing protein n=1 Tax=Jeotgalibacillus malaysiensis TaxID=1508404 RepID=A0A0B5AP46_9BACL|nr:type IV toxin-antitoxin system AbiEi family antitoxin domain-containing protein [Jeotgalibacillus malaysiensis]AJD90298.1 hypothetical protein JMA_09810 [Jeotgalibacillus malaysiensis]
MSYREKLEQLIKERSGIVVTSEAEKHGIPRHYLTVLLREGALEKVSHGVYITPDTFEDEMYIIQMRNPKVIFSHETAVFLHDLTDRDPLEWSVTVPTGYNTAKLKSAGIKAYSVKKTLHLMGAAEVQTMFGRKVIAYDRERTICDLIRNKNNMDIAVLNDSIKKYLNSKDKNIPLLMKYAGELRVQKILRTYMEVLL